MAITTDPGQKSRFNSPLWGLLLGIIFVGAVLGVLILFGVHEKLLELLNWIEGQGIWAAILFICLMAFVVVFFLPGIFVTTGAGFVFGVFQGTLYVVIGTTLGATIAFFIGRHFLGRRASRYILEKNQLGAINQEMSSNTFKVVLLTRLIPFFPSKVSNYLFGMTGFSTAGFIMASLIGFIPFSLNSVYLGSIAGDLAAVADGGVTRSPLEWALYAGGFLITVAAIIYFNRLAQRALSRYSDETGIQASDSIADESIDKSLLGESKGNAE